MRSPSSITRLGLSLGGLVIALGCEQRVDSPPPALTSIEPQVICHDQLTTSIAVAGTTLTPLPIRTLSGGVSGNPPQSLQLPALSLTRTASLEGAATSDAPVAIPDDPDNAAASHVKWQSESSMSFTVDPSLMLVDGVYDLTVKNPDGQAATLAHALAAVPPPRITKIEPMAICDDQADQTLTITGTGFLQIGASQPVIRFAATAGSGEVKSYQPTSMGGCVMVATSVRSGLQLCTSMVIIIKKGDLAPGSYRVSIENPAPANCTSSEPITVMVNPPPKIDSVFPKTICQGGGTLDIKGSNFQDMATVTLGMSPASKVTFVSPMELMAQFGGANAPFTPGMKYDLTVQNPDGCKDTLPGAVTAVAGPVLFFADPPFIYNGITTQVTFYTTSITPPLVSLTITPSGGGAAIPLTATIDPNHPKRILANVPAGTPAGSYDITIVDTTNCPASLVKGLTVVDKAPIVLTAINPPFGWQNAPTAVTITAASGLVATPRVYLNPHDAKENAVATALSSVAFVSPTKVTAVVPKGLSPAANPYDVILVNPDGTVGVLRMPPGSLFNSETNPPPLIDQISPGAVPTSGTPPVTISGANFRMPQVTFNCIINVLTGATMALSAPVSASSSSTITINNPPVGALASPTLCVIRVTNGDDMTYADFSALAITNPSGNLSAPKAATALPAARRAPVMLGSFATRTARFLYVVGGDNGMPVGALDTVLSTTSDETGTGSSWSTQRYRLNKPRTLASGVVLGRYLYVAGGNDGTGPVATAERAMVLDPLAAPVVTDVDIVPGGGMGLPGGVWNYRVAALMGANDPDNPGGESLPSDVFSLQLPDLSQKVQVTLTWSSVPGAAGYRIYRSAMPGLAGGLEQQLADVMGGNMLVYTDLGATPMQGTSPLPQGSTGAWRVLPAMAEKRESAAVVFGTDPADPAKHYLYATLGRAMNGAVATYEYLGVTVDNNGAQAVGANWTAGASQASQARYQHSAYSADRAIASYVPAGTNYVYLGGGTSNGSAVVQALEVGKVKAGGDLGAFTPTGATVKSFGMGYTVAANYLYTFGDEGPSTAIRAGQLDVMPPAVVNFNNNGGGLLIPRYLPGTALQGALIYLAGGSEMGRTGATTSVEWMIW